MTEILVPDKWVKFDDFVLVVGHDLIHLLDVDLQILFEVILLDLVAEAINICVFLFFEK